jgi:hypothetical protein
MIDTNQNQEIEFAAFVGIDWADQKHAWALQIPGHREIEPRRLWKSETCNIAVAATIQPVG